VIDTSLLLCILFVLLSSFLFFKSALDFFLDEELLSSCGSDKFDVFVFKFTLVFLELLSLELHLGAFGVE